MVVFFDIDGTIVDNDSQIIPASAVRAVEALIKNGHTPVVNTGRPFSHIDPRVRKMAFQGWVAGCGMEIRLDGERIFFRTPDEALCRYVVDAVRTCSMRALYELEDGAIALDDEYSDHPVIAAEAVQMRDKGFEVRALSQVPKFMKFVTYDAPGCQREKFLSMMEDRFTCIDRGNTMLEMMLLGCSKAAGMVRLLEHLGIDRADTLAIGDSTNDLPMFGAAGHTVCMGGGMDELKAHAEYITDTVMNDGIEKALRHYGLI